MPVRHGPTAPATSSVDNKGKDRLTVDTSVMSATNPATNSDGQSPGAITIAVHDKSEIGAGFEHRAARPSPAAPQSPSAITIAVRDKSAIGDAWLAARGNGCHRWVVARDVTTREGADRAVLTPQDDDDHPRRRIARA